MKITEKIAPIKVLQYRELIVEKEFVTSKANNDLAMRGQWSCDYQFWFNEIDAKINALGLNCKSRKEPK